MSQPIFLPTDPFQMSVQSPSIPIFTRGLNVNGMSDAMVNQVAEVQRSGDQAGLLTLVAQMANQMGNMERAMTSANVPVRENLEAEASVLVPLETPLRNRLPRVPGAGLASKWKVITSLGGGYGAASTSSGTNNAGQPALVLASVAGFNVGDTILVGNGGTVEQHKISAINTGTNTLTLGANLANAQNTKPVVKVFFQPGGGSAVRAFFTESGAPADHSTVYAEKTASYKLLGSMGDVTGFGMAAGASFQNQLATEKTNQIRNTMLNEENALINASSTSVLAPWGDGTTAMGFDGMLALISVANGTPVDQVQSAVGQLTTAHIDAQLNRLWLQGAQDMYMMMGGQEIASLAKIASQSGNYRIMVDQKAATIGASVVGYIHPTTGQVIPILPSRFISPGTIIFGSDRLPDGKAAAEVEVLPQVQLPSLAPNMMIQGYVAQEIAPSKAAPQVYPFLVSVFEVLKLKSSLHFAVSTGVTPA